MNLEKYTIINFLSVIFSAGFGAMVVALVGRRKTNAEALLAKAQTKLTEIELYSKMLTDLKDQSDRQQEQMGLQQKQILTLQGQNTEYLKIINAQNSRERSLQKRIKQLENELSVLKQQFQDEKN